MQRFNSSIVRLEYFQGHKYVKFQFSGVELLTAPNLRSTRDNRISLTDAIGTVVSDKTGTGVAG